MSWKRAYRKASIEKSLKIEVISETPADMLIPAEMVSLAWNLRNRSGEWRDMVRYLLNRHRLRILRLADHATRVRFLYQSPGLGLHRISYLPYMEVHVDLRMMSYAARISMCALITLMMIWEQEGIADEEIQTFFGVPIESMSSWRTNGKKLSITASIQMSATYHPPP